MKIKGPKMKLENKMNTLMRKNCFSSSYNVFPNVIGTSFYSRIGKIIDTA